MKNCTSQDSFNFLLCHEILSVQNSYSTCTWPPPSISRVEKEGALGSLSILTLQSISSVVRMNAAC